MKTPKASNSVPTTSSARKVVKRKIPVHQGRGGMVAGINPVSNKSMLDAADNKLSERMKTRQVIDCFAR